MVLYTAASTKTKIISDSKIGDAVVSVVRNGLLGAVLYIAAVVGTSLHLHRARAIRRWRSWCILILQSHSPRVPPLVIVILVANPAMSCLNFLLPHVRYPDRIGRPELAR